MRKKLSVAAASLFAVVGLTPSAASAWGCVAVASDGAYGYSYDWPSEQDAELTALQQCDARSGSDDCETESCDPEG